MLSSTITKTIRYIFCVSMLLTSYQAFATHYRAGEILYERIAERRYRIVAYSYTDPTSRADANTIQIDLYFGDGQKASVQRSGRRLLSARVVQNTYEVIHDYKLDGWYKISFFDQNRVNGIININNGLTELIPFYVETEIRINQGFGPNNSPILTKPPIDNGCVDRPYYHNPAAYDPDGDSITFQLIPPKSDNGIEVPQYSDPEADNAFSIGLHNGQLYWDSPKQKGIYNIAILISEYRKGQLIGRITRDMQIFIEQCLNAPPILQNVDDGCVVVGDSISRVISASDPNTFQNVRLTGYGGAFATQNMATMSPDPAVGQAVVGTIFKWKPACLQVRLQPWLIIFEAKDDDITNPAVSQNTFFIKVVAPPVINLKTQQVDNGFKLTWNQDTCRLASEYKIYRRTDSSHWNPAYCETGIPASTGFVQIASVSTINNPNSTEYYDNNNGRGLSPLVTYCYRIVSVYPPRNTSGQSFYSDPSESMASVEICDNIILNKPVITRVSVLQTNTVTGKIEVSYLRPDTLDTTVYLPPYRLILKKAITGEDNYTDVNVSDYSTFAGMSDLDITDSLLNTTANQYTYKVDMWATVNGVFKFIEASPEATSVRGIMYSTDRMNIVSWQYQVPWLNDTFTVYRKNQLGIFDSVAYTTANSYRDTGLINDVEYCYVVRSHGHYRARNQEYITINFSQELCGTPIDTVRPCPPALLVVPPCDQLYDNTNKLSWTPQYGGCADDVVNYKVYYKQLKEDNYKLLAELPSSQLSYIDDRKILEESITGCYYVAGVDSANNESFPTNEVCIDNCPFYDIPNVFTPNGDGKNDLLLPFPYRFVSSIDMVIFNRWGLPVFNTQNKDILWDGKDLQTKEDCPEGVYYYVCEVYEVYLSGIKKRTLKGTIQIIRK
jgi:gliding motility-associated-like protein